MGDGPTGERWLPVVGWEGLYEVSDLGRVRSLDRMVDRGANGVLPVRGRVLSLARGKLYSHVHLSGRGVKVPRYVHQLVIEAFVGPRPYGQVVCHGPNGPRDNQISNLSYGTESDNGYDRRRDGTDIHVNRRECPLGHMLVEPNIVASEVRRGHRACLACSRGRTKVRNAWRRHRIVLDVKTEADSYYLTIMKGGG